jgi:hypothetical protein
MPETEDEYQVLHLVKVIHKEQNFKISIVKTRVMAFTGSENTRTEILLKTQ